MVKAIDVAQRIYDSLGWVDAWKLQKLTYYVQAWSLGWYGRPLFDGYFEAWVNGPVEPSLYQANKNNRESPKGTTIHGADSSTLNEWQRAVVASVINYYAGFSSAALVEITHSESPWIKARGDMSPHDRSNAPVLESEMKKFYAAQEVTSNDGPRRPFLTLAQPDSTEAALVKLEAQAERWKGALALLAEK